MASAKDAQLKQDITRLQALLRKRSENMSDAGAASFKGLATVLQKCIDGKLVDTYSMARELTQDANSDIADFPVDSVTVGLYASALGYATPRSVEAMRTDSGYGFNIMGGNSVGMPVYVSRVLPGGPAHRQGKLKKGDQILVINGKCVSGMQHDELVSIMRSAPKVQLVVNYAPHLLGDMEENFEAHRRVSARRHSAKRASAASTDAGR